MGGQAPAAGVLLPGWVRWDPASSFVTTQFPDDSISDSTRLLALSIVCRTITPEQVYQLIQHLGADPNVVLWMRAEGGTGGEVTACSLLSWAIDGDIDNTIPSAWARTSYGISPIVLPRWSSVELQNAVLQRLIINGADPSRGFMPPLRIAIQAGNEAAFRLLLDHNVPLDMEMLTLPGSYDNAMMPGPDQERQLLSMYRRLLQRDSSLATQVDGALRNVLHLAGGRAQGWYSQAFIDDYIGMVISNGGDIRPPNFGGNTPLHFAAMWGSHRVAFNLCIRLSSDDINRGTPNDPADTPLAAAAQRLDFYFEVQQQQQQEQTEVQRERRERLVRQQEVTIPVLLRAGAAPSIALMPTASEEQRRQRSLLLPHYATVLNELPEVVMSAINAALAPQRDRSMLLARLLPLAPHHDGAHPHPSPSNMAFGPHEAEAIAWKIGAFLDEPPAAVAAIDQYLIGESLLRRRVRAAVGHFVKSAATQTNSNREVVGGTRYQQQGDKRVKVTVPPLQCFAVKGSGGKLLMTGVREVVHRARLDEVRQHGLEGVVKGFNEHLSDQDCQFEWGQLGRLSRTGLFVPLGIE
ncbi:unnamed protein product [Vitrella brassicaformis CCMP3155]|uniref:Uncharacterized protein n=2 Tax=Vitrella brassicaformis TaxID=1169539 RepID=A0A0G4G382_VITBC|nr:unnamed protein product [Vitrella brassicaformis CCMP3155]|eukprot:CEM22709.1 unnamed protein product [Vitrella brassicaformis CCMP3155]